MIEEFDVYCDVPGCPAAIRLVKNGGSRVLAVLARGIAWVVAGADPATALGPGWGQVVFRAPAGTVELDFCAMHLETAVVPWIEQLSVLEAASQMLGEPSDQVDLDTLVPPAALPPLAVEDQPEALELEEVSIMAVDYLGEGADLDEPLEEAVA